MTNVRARRNAARTHKRPPNAEADRAFAAKTVRQLVVSAVVAGAVFAVTKIDTPQCKSVIASVDNTLRYTVDYKAASLSIYETMKKLPRLFGEAEDDTPAADTPAEAEPAGDVPADPPADGGETTDEENADVPTN
ncbi:MAG: hypothetical protein LBH54_02720 [Clostridiales bacterium]|jgi:hypothetical protein|nr:hypothetical protein [Clostridiales bacterium]